MEEEYDTNLEQNQERVENKEPEAIKVEDSLDLNTSNDTGALESSLIREGEPNKHSEIGKGVSERIITDEEYTPKLFSENTESIEESATEKNEEEQTLFDQDNNEEEDFSIPAFLRRQKF